MSNSRFLAFVCLMSLVAYGAFLRLSFPCIYWGDDGLLLTASHSLGIGHPPGHTLFMHWMRLPFCIPLGDVAVRSNLFVAATSVLSIVFSMLILQSHSKSLSGSFFASLVFCSILVLNPYMIRQSIRSETYSLQLLLMTLIVFFLHKKTKKSILMSAFLFGCSSANQLLIAALCFPGLLLMFAASFRWIHRKAATIILCVLMFLLSYSMNLYIVIRANYGTTVRFSECQRFQEALEYLTAKSYQQSFMPDSIAAQAKRITHAGSILLKHTSGELGFLTLAALGLATLLYWMTDQSLRTFGIMTMFGVLLLGSLSIRTFDPENWDFQGYLLTALWACAISISLLIIHLFNKGKQAFAVGISLVLTFIIATSFYGSLDLWDKESHRYISRRYALSFLEFRAPDSVILMRSDAYYPVLFIHLIERMNTNVSLWSRNYLLRSAGTIQLHEALNQEGIRLPSQYSEKTMLNELISLNVPFRDIAWELADDNPDLSDFEFCKIDGGVIVFGYSPEVAFHNLSPDLWHAPNLFCSAQTKDWHAREQLGMMQYNRGTFFLKRSICTDAADAFVCANRFLPNNSKILNNYAIALACNGDYHGALDVLEDLKRLNPEHPGYERNREYIMEKLNGQQVN